VDTPGKLRRFRPTPELRGYRTAYRFGDWVALTTAGGIISLGTNASAGASGASNPERENVALKPYPWWNYRGLKYEL